jgi:DNA invertase Pin-like site-specific DNA recombinase
MNATELASIPSKIQGRHLERLAVVYVRQSTAQQVLDHRESTALQYGLRARAIQWGWPEPRVLVIDQDLGHSAQSPQSRAGFQQLLAEVSLGHVGLVLGLEMSRIARCSGDWHRLLEVCALFDTLLADQDGLYDPRQYNDRLLLGLKGTISEAELHILRQRMHEGRLNKARRGELLNHAPIGYVRLADGGLGIDPDEQVQAVVRLVFDKFDELGTLSALLRYLVAQGIRMPVRPIGGPQRGQLQWHRPVRMTLQFLLRNPVYAGAYTWGRRAVDPRAKIPGRPCTGRKVIAPKDCQVFIKDRWPAYIDWPRYEANCQRLADNRARGDTRGAPRLGPSLLAGIIFCGRCGRRMGVQYGGAVSRLRYQCMRERVDYAGPLCQSICGRVLDELAQRLVLSALEPASLELSLAAAADLKHEQERLDRHWQLQLERARYECDRAARSYHAVEPENRLVARELEKRWEQALLDQRRAEEDYDRYRHGRPAALNEAGSAMVRSLAQDIPALWESPQTTPADRQQVVRCLIQKVLVTAPGNQEVAEVDVHWAGGFVSHHQVIHPVARYEHLRDYESLCRRVLELRRQGQPLTQIAQTLNAERWRPPKRRATFNAGMVHALLCRRGQAPTRPSNHRLAPGEWWSADLARELELPEPTLYSWMRRGWVNARRLASGQGRWILWADGEELDRLRRLRTCPRSWHNQPQAAALTTPKPWPQQPPASP